MRTQMTGINLHTNAISILKQCQKGFNRPITFQMHRKIVYFNNGNGTLCRNGITECNYILSILVRGTFVIWSCLKRLIRIKRMLNSLAMIWNAITRAKKNTHTHTRTDWKKQKIDSSVAHMHLHLKGTCANMTPAMDCRCKRTLWFDSVCVCNDVDDFT